MWQGLQGRDLMVVSSDYDVAAGDSFWESLPKSFLLSICSSVIPVGYTNDRHSHHPRRLKGGMFVLLNFFFNTVWIGLALGFTIVHNVPNNVQGISIPQPSVKVEVRCTIRKRNQVKPEITAVNRSQRLNRFPKMTCYPVSISKKHFTFYPIYTQFV